MTRASLKQLIWDREANGPLPDEPRRRHLYYFCANRCSMGTHPFVEGVLLEIPHKW